MRSARPDRPWLKGIRFGKFPPATIRDSLPVEDWNAAIPSFCLEYRQDGVGLSYPRTASFRLGQELLGLTGSCVYNVAGRMARDAVTTIPWDPIREVMDFLLDTPLVPPGKERVPRSRSGQSSWRVEVVTGDSAFALHSRAMHGGEPYWIVEFGGRSRVSHSLRPGAALRALEPWLRPDLLDDLAREYEATWGPR